jgi:hypothetical protein
MKVDLDDDVFRQWAELLASYRDAHTKDEIHRVRNGVAVAPEDYLGDKPGEPAWSWHLAKWGTAGYEDLMELPKNTLCYADMDGDEVWALYPVALSRLLYEASPAELAADAKLGPAADLGEFSAADRVFGWVSPSGRAEGAESSGVRGRVRVGPVEMVSGPGVELVERGLAVLGQPRPTQDVFYAAKNGRGEPLGPRPGTGRGMGCVAARCIRTSRTRAGIPGCGSSGCCTGTVWRPASQR